MKLAITGATGFIGARFAQRWIEGGGGLRALVRHSSKREALDALGAELAVVDLELGTGLEEALRGCDALLHLAGVVRAWDWETYERVNAHATRRLAEAARAVGVERFVLVSSLAAAGPSPPDRALREEDEPAPIVPYGRSKLLAERALAAEAEDGLTWSVVRPTVVYGPGDRDVFELFKLCRRRLVPFAAPPGGLISMIHVDDLCALLEACLERAPSGGLYFATDGEAYDWPRIIRAVGAGMGRAVSPLRVPPGALWPVAALAELTRPFRSRPPVLSLQKLAEARQPAWLCSGAKAEAELGFRAGVELEEGMRGTAAWYREQGWL